VLTHIPPWNDELMTYFEAKEEFPGRLEVAKAGTVYTV
jgi:ribonuclease BN (tRNA processing enzyme)